MNNQRVADPAFELIKEIRALEAGTGGISPADNTNVRSLAHDITDAYHNIESMAVNPFVDPADAYYRSALQYYRAKTLRGKRCLVTYLMWRMDRVSAAWWESKDNLITPQLGSAEVQYLKEYNALMVDYMSSFAFPIDLRAFRLRPPSAQHVSVRGVKPLTFMSALSGITYHIEKDETYSMPSEEAERLIQQGIVIEVSA
jgi:GINS complex subunit 1